MLSVDEALAQILEAVPAFPVSSVRLSDAYGLVLAESVTSDVDSPPFDKALMDGYAVRSADVAGEQAMLSVIEEVMAGQVPVKTVAAGEVTRIMTGAPMPDGADAVVPVEQTQLDADGDSVVISASAVKVGDHLMKRGAALKQGEHVLSAGTRLRPQELGALAEFGQAEVPLRRKPHVAVLATGDELVSIETRPGPGQIRNSNATMLAAQIERAGGEAHVLEIARDNRDDLGRKIRAGLEYDILLLSGGVSAGKADLVPSELEAAGVRQLFHKVNVKPGKPIWFGVAESADPSGANTEKTECFVFGLPGNPVSSMVCFELFTRTAIRKLMGDPEPGVQTTSARLAQTHESKGNRPTYHPSCLVAEAAELRVTPVPWSGSADLRATVEANSTIIFPAGRRRFEAGEVVNVVDWA